MGKLFKNKKVLFGFLAVIMMTALIATLVLCIPMDSHEGSHAQTHAVAGTISSNDGKVEDGYDPAINAGAKGIYNEGELKQFIKKEGVYAGVNYAYLINDVTLNWGLNLGGMVLDKGRTIDGNGHKITVTTEINSGSNDSADISGVMVTAAGGAAIMSPWVGEGTARTAIYAAGGLLGVNYGSIINAELVYTSSTYMFAPGTSVSPYNCPVSVSPFVGVNVGNIVNVKATVATGAVLRAVKDWTTYNAATDTQNITLGGLAGYNFGYMEYITMEINGSLFAEVGGGKTASDTIVCVGGVVGVTISDSQGLLGGDVHQSELKNVTILGSRSGIILAHQFGARHSHRRVGTVVGGNSWEVNRPNGAAGFSVGRVDGVLIGYEGQTVRTEYTWDSVTGTDDMSMYQVASVSGTGYEGKNPGATKAAIGCGAIGNVIYADGYSGNVDTCGCADGRSFRGEDGHHNTKATSVRATNEMTGGYDVNYEILRTSDSTRFSVKVSVETLANSIGNLIYDIANSKSTITNTNNTEIKAGTPTVIGGINYFNSPIKYFDEFATDLTYGSNYKKAVFNITENVSATDLDFTEVKITWGKEVKLRVDPIASNVTFNANNDNLVKYRVTDFSESNVLQVDVSNLLSTATYENYSGLSGVVTSLWLPGQYSDIQVANVENPYVSYLDEVNKLVARPYTHSSSVEINYDTFALTGANPDPNIIYKNFSFPVDTKGGRYNIYYMTNSLGIAQKLDDGRVFTTTTPVEGWNMRFYATVGYAFYGSDKVVEVPVTPITDPCVLKIDATPPVVELVDDINFDADWSSDTVNVRFKVSDSMSGVKEVKVNTTVLTATDGIYSFTIADDKLYTILVSDMLNNTYSRNIKLKIDQTLPTFEWFTTQTGNVAVDEFVSIATSVYIRNIVSGISGYSLTLMRYGIDENGVVGEGQEIELSGTTVKNFKTIDNHKNKYVVTITAGNGKTFSKEVTSDLTKKSIDLNADGVVTYSANANIRKEFDNSTFMEDKDFNLLQFKIFDNGTQVSGLRFSKSYEYVTSGVGNSVDLKITIKDTYGAYDYGDGVYIISGLGKITRKNVTVAIRSQTRKYAEINPEFDYTITGVVNGDVNGLRTLNNVLNVGTNANLYSSAGGQYYIKSDKNLADINAALLGTGYAVTTINENATLTIVARVLDIDSYRVDVPTGASYNGDYIKLKAEYLSGNEWLPLGVVYAKWNYNAYFQLPEASPFPKDTGKYRATLVDPNANYTFGEDKVFVYELHKASLDIKIDGESTDGSVSLAYDGKEKVIIPKIYNDGKLVNSDITVTVVYTDENAKVVDSIVQVGRYKVTIKVDPKNSSNYFIAERQLTLYVNAANFVANSGVELLGGGRFEKSDLSRGIKLSNLPIGTTVEVSVNNIAHATMSGEDAMISVYSASNVGDYTISVVLLNDNYNTVTLSTKLNITMASISGFTFSGKNVAYDGNSHAITIEDLADDVAVELTYKGVESKDGVIIDNANRLFSATNAGIYLVTVKLSKDGYLTTYATATLNIAKGTLTGFSFDGLTIEYDGTEHKIEVKVADGISLDGIRVKLNAYSNAEDEKIGAWYYTATNAGSKTIIATVTKANYNKLELRATLNVKKANYDNVKVDNLEAVYTEGGQWTLNVQNVPANTKVTIYNSSLMDAPMEATSYTLKSAGSYRFIVEISPKEGNNYATKTYYATVKIAEADFDSNLVLNFDNVTFDGAEHLAILNGILPSGTTVTWLVNGKEVTDLVNNTFALTNAGKYKVEITIRKDNYKSRSITKDLTITEANMDTVEFKGAEVTFNEQDHSIMVAGVPNGAEVVMTSGSGIVSDDKTTFTARHAGKYVVTIEVTLANYKTYKTSATLNIKQAQISGFKFDKTEFAWQDGATHVVSVVTSDGTAVDTNEYLVKMDGNHSFINAGKYVVNATVSRVGEYADDYKVMVLYSNVKVSGAIIADNIRFQSQSYTYDGTEKSITLTGVPEGAKVEYTAGLSYTNSGSYTVGALVSMPNHETVTITGVLVISPVKVKVQYLTIPIYPEKQQPRVIGRYVDINGNTIHFLVDTSAHSRGKAGEFNLKIRSTGNPNYVPTTDTSSVDIVIGPVEIIKSSAAAVGAVAGGAVAATGIIGGVALAMKRKIFKL